MSNKGDYNYYKSEYGKYKNNYYTPGSARKGIDKKRKKKIMMKRFFRAFLVFFIIFLVIAALIFGGYKLVKYLKDNKANAEPTTSVSELTEAPSADEPTTNDSMSSATTTSPDSTTAPADVTENVTPGSFETNTAYYIKTKDGTGVNVRNQPSYDVGGMILIADGTKVQFVKFSDDKQWGYTSNLSRNGWINLSYVVSDYVPANAGTSAQGSSGQSESTTLGTYSNTYAQNKTSFNEALAIFGADNSHNLYMNCKVVSSTTVEGKKLPSDSAAKASTFSNGTAVPVYSVRYGYAKTRVNGAEVWLPTSCLEFVSWGHYR